VVLLASLLAGAGGCHKKAPPPPEVTELEPAVQAPEGLVADVVIASPNALWGRVQRGVGGLLGILPASFGGLLVAAAGLDVAFASEIDGAAPAFAVLARDTASQGGSWSFVVAARLVDGPHARAALAADAGHFEAKESGAFTIIAARSGAPTSLAVALTRNGYLLVAASEGALAALGPYAYRTLPTRAVPPGGLAADVPHAALVGSLRAEAVQRWASARADALKADADLRAQHGGRAPDFGDAPAILASVGSVVDRLMAIEGDLDGVHAVVDADEATVHAVVTLTPSQGAGPATAAFARMAVGDATPLQQLPADTTLGLMTRDTAATRSEDAVALEAAIVAALGARAGADDKKKLHGAIADWTNARGDWLTAALASGKTVRLTARTPASGDAAAATHAAREIVELSTLPAMEGPLKSLVGATGMTVADQDMPGLERAGMAMFIREKPGAAGFGVAWGAREGDLRIAAAEDARGLLLAGVTAKTLADDPLVTSMLGALGDRTSLAVIARPFPSDSASLPVLTAGWGSRGPTAWARVDASFGFVREVVRRAGP